MSGFQTTRWSLVLDARSGDYAARAFAELCRAYRAPVLAFVRARGHSATEAEDLTQSFFLTLIEKRYDLSADPQRGRFRSFLLTAVKGFLANRFDASRAQKRGGGAAHECLTDEPPGTMNSCVESPELAFERAFAMAVVERATQRLRDEMEAAGHAAQFAALAGFALDAPDSGDYAALSVSLGVPPNTLAARVSRLRARLRELIRSELADTLADRVQVDREMRALRGALRR